MSKTAFITGAGGYLGSQCALQLAKEGINVAVSDINEAAVNKTLERINEIGGKAKGYVFDVSDSKQVDKAVNDAYKTFGSLDIMIHVAGGSSRIAGGKNYYLFEQEDEVIDRVLKINLYGAFWTARAASRIMIENEKGGKILFFSSAVGINGLAGCCDYAASKGGVMSLTKALAKEMGRYNINVNAIAPGVVVRPDEEVDRSVGTSFLKTKCTAEDVAQLASFLVSDKAKFITGQTYVIDGGRTLSMKGTD